MHSHVSRDRFIEIIENNIRPDMMHQFKKVNPEIFGNFGTDYDIFSVMHYDSKAFTKNGLDTILPRNRRFTRIIGHRRGLSQGDIKRINNMYECKSSAS